MGLIKRDKKNSQKGLIIRDRGNTYTNKGQYSNINIQNRHNNYTDNFS
jgi:hypothetical protein